MRSVHRGVSSASLKMGARFSESSVCSTTQRGGLTEAGLSAPPTCT